MDIAPNSGAFQHSDCILDSENITSEQPLLFVCVTVCAVLTSTVAPQVLYKRVSDTFKSAVSKSNVNVNLLQTYANAGKTSCVRMGCVWGGWGQKLNGK